MMRKQASVLFQQLMFVVEVSQRYTRIQGDGAVTGKAYSTGKLDRRVFIVIHLNKINMRSFFFHPTVTSMKKKKIVEQRATVAAVQDVDDNGNTRFRFGTAICSPKDQFVKKYGRSAAYGKAVSKGPTLSLTTAETFGEEYSYTSFFLENAIRLLMDAGFSVKEKTKNNVTA